MRVQDRALRAARQGFEILCQIYVKSLKSVPRSSPGKEHGNTVEYGKGHFEKGRFPTMKALDVADGDPSGALRFGVVVPPENPTAEPEFHRLLGDAANVYTTRFPTTPGRGLREMLETYNEVLPATLGDFGAMRLDAAVVACSASHYLLGPERDRAFCERLGERAGYPVRSSTQTVLWACERLGIARLRLVSPYEPWLTETSRGYWEAAGLTVQEVVTVPASDGGYDPYRVTTRQILDRVRPGRIPRGTALMFTGTGMSTLAALGRLAQQDGVLLTTNLAAAWWAREEAGAGGGHHPLISRLRAQAELGAPAAR